MERPRSLAISLTSSFAIPSSRSGILIPAYTDARQFSRLGMDCYGFGPLALAPEDAAALKSRIHGVDERVPRDAFLKGYMILEDAVLSFVSSVT